MSERPSHVAEDGTLVMVDVSAKPQTERIARASARLRMKAQTEQTLRDAALPKGDALVAAQIAGIFAAKQTATLIPLAHPLPLSAVEVTFSWIEPGLLEIVAMAKTTAQTGVEMEAMTAAAIAALTIYDMTKSVERGVTIESLRLLEKSGGKSGHWRSETP